MSSTSVVATPAGRWPIWLRLFIISFASLYLELMIIRWLPTQLRILAYFSNLTLVSCIFGLGLGAVRSRLGGWSPRWSMVFLAALLMLTWLYRGFDLQLPLADATHFLWNGLSRVSRGTPLQYVALMVFLAITVCVFVPVGALLGREFDRLAPLKAYAINVAGAITGIAVFALMSALSLAPLVWFAVGILSFLPFLPLGRTEAVLAGVCLGLAGIGSFERNTIWSPYYKVTRQEVASNGVGLGFDLSVNEDSHQQAIDLSGRFDTIPDLLTRRRIYDEPYRFGSNQRVLIVGAGTGNDVAAAIRAGASTIVAVDIDREILRLGTLHPEQPYADPRVTTVVADARSFIRSSTQRWDKIVLGYLDSHSLFSAMSSVRLDNFVYTTESFREFRDHLTPDGVLAVTFTVHEAWIADRIHGMLGEAFGYAPLVFQGNRTSSSGTVFLAGAPVRTVQISHVTYDPRAGDAGPSWRYDETQAGYLRPSVFAPASTLPSDNWPYLYLRERGLPANYLTSIVVLLLLAVAATLWTMRGGAAVNLQFFFLGAGFLLVETKAMTELGLFMGSTWTVNVLVIISVLLLILLANTLASRSWCPPSRVFYLGLFLVLVASWAFPLSPLLSWNSPARNPLAVLILTLPLFFAGVIFSRELRTAPSASGALGANLLGALFGGAAEYSGMLLGLRSLYLIGLGFYALAWLSSHAERSRVPQPVGPASVAAR